MTYRKVVIEMDGPDGKQVTFPRPGGYQIVWSPGSVTVPLERAASGHPMMPIGAFNQVPKDIGQRGSSPPKPVTFHATRQHAERERENRQPYVVKEVESNLGTSCLKPKATERQSTFQEQKTPAEAAENGSVRRYQ